MSLQKLQELRKLIGSGMTEEDIQTLTTWERTLKRDELYASFKKHPVTKMILDQLTVMILAKNTELSTDRTLNDPARSWERSAIMESRDALLWVIKLFDDRAPIAQLEQHLDNKIEEWSTYRNNI